MFLVFALLIGLSGRVMYSSETFGQNFRLILMSEFAGMLFGTTLYLFTKTALIGEKPKPMDLVHYIPSVAYMVFALVYFVFPADDVLIQRRESGEMERDIFLNHAIGLIVNITYWLISFRALYNFKSRLQDEASYSVKTNFFFGLHAVIGVCLGIWATAYLLSLFVDPMLERNMRSSIWLSLALIVLFIALYGMINPKIYQLKAIEEIRKYSRSKLSQKDLTRLKEALDTLMQEKKPYLNNKLLKTELAEMLGISNPEMARLLNERIGMNFFEYVNYYRIKEFIELAKSPKAEQLTLFGLAQEVGFNSKATFNNSFKKLMGTTPSNYFNGQNT